VKRFSELFLYVVLSAFSSSMLAACGYQFQVEGPGPTIGGGPAPAAKSRAPRLAIPIFENRSIEPNLEVKYTAYTRQEFAVGSGARVVIDSEPPELLMKAHIVSVIIPTLTFSIDRTLESRVTVQVRAMIEDVRTGKTLWNQLVTASSEFFITEDLQFNRVLQTRALEQAGRLIAEDLAARFLDQLESGSLQKAAAATTTKDGMVAPVLPPVPDGLPGRGGGP
jgi:Lipopolysaccharide-assembly